MGAGDGQVAWLICRFCERPAHRSSLIAHPGFRLRLRPTGRQRGADPCPLRFLHAISLFLEGKVCWLSTFPQNEAPSFGDQKKSKQMEPPPR